MNNLNNTLRVMFLGICGDRCHSHMYTILKASAEQLIFPFELGESDMLRSVISTQFTIDDFPPELDKYNKVALMTYTDTKTPDRYPIDLIIETGGFQGTLLSLLPANVIRVDTLELPSPINDSNYVKVMRVGKKCIPNILAARMARTFKL